MKASAVFNRNRDRPRVVGLDVSLARTGIALSHTMQAWAVPTSKKTPMHERLDTIARAVRQAAHGCDLAVIEAPSYASDSGTRHQLYGAWWIAAHALWVAGVPYATVPPSTLKKYATGYGGSAKHKVGKPEMVAAARRAWPGVDIPAAGDEADALWLAAMGSHRLGRPLAHQSVSAAKALAVVDWPALDRAA